MTGILTPPSFPLFGTYVLYGVMLVASYTFAVALAAGADGRPRTLAAARSGAYGTVALVFVAVLCLAYAFVTHDFRLRYVEHYSDRSMSLPYLFTALWGGQDGSLLWWLFLLSLYTGACVKWLGRRYLELQPWVIATLMSIVLFFCVLMAFAANPFSTSVAGAKPDGEGLNPLLQNFYMIIHPPSLYVGFVGCSVPFAFAIAALATGRLDHEWIVASRKWTLFAWLFLAIGNTLGMLWAYEELGWGGYWAWDPVENAAFMPFLTATAYVHSVMIQERRGLFKVWNVFLVCFTFFMTIFGTFLTRSGMIASVHSFAQSDIGPFFLRFLAGLVAVAATLVFYRWPELRNQPARPELRRAAIAAGWTMIAALGPGILFIAQSELPIGVKTLLWAGVGGGGVFCAIELVYRRMTRGISTRAKVPEMESVLSREFTFMLNNWILLGIMLFILIATTFPMVSEAFWSEKITVGPPFYGAWLPPLGLLMYTLMGIGTLFGWKKTSHDSLRRAFVAPVVVTILAAVLHFALGRSLGYPAVVWSEPIYAGPVGSVLRAVNAYLPVVGLAASAFNAAVIVQEFVALFRARGKTGASKSTPAWLYFLGGLPGFFHALVSLAPQARRRYGGYVVHLGIVIMFVGFTGKSWNVDKETVLTPGQTFQVADYTIEYAGPRMEVDASKRMVFADIRVKRGGEAVGQLAPAKFIYKKMPESPTTEVSMLHSVRDDLYLVVGTINPQTKTASLQVHVNALVSWIWAGAIVLIFGSIVTLWPELAAEESRAWAFARMGAGVAASVAVGLALAMTPARAYAQGSSTHAGTVRIDNDRERQVFTSLRCLCGGCQRLELSSCACAPADDTRAELRAMLAAGMTPEAVVAKYAREHGTDALTVPPNSGALRAIYALPLTALAAGGVGLGVALRRWRKRDDGGVQGRADAAKATPPVKDDYDTRLDEELRDLE